MIYNVSNKKLKRIQDIAYAVEQMARKGHTKTSVGLLDEIITISIKMKKEFSDE